jgi:membrane protein implicated in regulation of membrane protease activity
MRTEVVMTIPGPFRAGDVASMLLDLVPDDPCSDDTIACALRSLVDYMVPLTLVFAACVILGLVLALSFSIFTARHERVPARRTQAHKRILSEPIHTDGTWVRLVEDDAGGRMIEVLDGSAWRATSRDLETFALDVPLTLRPRG